MKLIAQLRLTPAPAQSEVLRHTLKTAIAACNYISEIAWTTQQFKQSHLYRLCYRTVRERFGLSAQMAINCLGKVSDAYKLERHTRKICHQSAGLVYDDRMLSWNLAASHVSIWTLEGRLTIPFICGKRERRMLRTRQGRTDLVYVCASWYLLAPCEIDEPEPRYVLRFTC